MYDLGEEKGSHYITMEFVPGEDLHRLIRKVGQFSAGKTISIAKQVCEGLAEAHRLKVVHRDLKPQNIMVDEEGNVRIMDFGIARSIKAEGITGAGVMIGTPEYMSPEQAEVKDIDHRRESHSAKKAYHFTGNHRNNRFEKALHPGLGHYRSCGHRRGCLAVAPRQKNLADIHSRDQLRKSDRG